MVKVTINHSSQRFNGQSELIAILDRVKTTPDLEIWVQHQNGSSACALLNQCRGWMMFLRFPEDVGLSSRNLQLEDNGDQAEYCLANGQVDQYPKHWSYPRDNVFAAIVEYSKTGEPAQILEWHDDGA